MGQFNLTGMTRQPTYDPVAVQPMRVELTSVGFDELLTPEDVDKMLDRKDDETVMVVLNSVCGCAAGSLRPGAIMASQHNTIPNHLVTLFAGMEKDAVDHYRSKYLANHMPSSPSMALFKNGQPIHILHRANVEGRQAEDIAEELKAVFDKECNRQGPSISEEEFEKISQGKRICGSKIPKYQL